MDKCTCKTPGYCERYGAVVNPLHWMWCRGLKEANPKREAIYIGMMNSVKKEQKNQKIDIKKILQFIIGLLEFIKSGYKRVSEEEKKRRTSEVRRFPSTEREKEITRYGYTLIPLNSH